MENSGAVLEQDEAGEDAVEDPPYYSCENQRAYLDSSRVLILREILILK